MVAKINIIYVFLWFTSVSCVKFACNHESAVKTFKKPTYDFSVRLLDRVAQQSGYHFVFSPLSTWLQLMTLAEGAKGPTETEIRKVTKHHRMKCFRRKYREVLNSIDEELGFMSKRTNVIVVNKLLDVKKSYKDEVRKSDSSKFFALNFNDPEEAAAKVNEEIEMDMDGVITDGLNAEDFNFTLLLMTESAYFKSDWQTSFNPVYTSKEPFYSEEEVMIGQVKIMTQTGYFNLTDVPYIDAKVLELPFNTEGRISMLVLLPNRGSVKNLVYHLKDIQLATILSQFKKEGAKLVKVQLPRFQINTDIQNIPELVNDMGVRRIFYPELANLRGISDFKLYTSVMKQKTNIEVTEKGATVSSIADFLIVGSTEEFVVNRPFVYLIVDRKTGVILFGGIYSNPSIY